MCIYIYIYTYTYIHTYIVSTYRSRLLGVSSFAFMIYDSCQRYDYICFMPADAVVVRRYYLGLLSEMRGIGLEPDTIGYT